MLPVRKICFCALLLIAGTCMGQVNMQTGSATFSLPIFDWKDNVSRLYATVGLNYSSANGLKTNEVASNVGQGWNLIAGGVITRMQVGEPDDQKPYDGVPPSNPWVNQIDINKYPAGYWYKTKIPANGCPLTLAKYPLYKSMNRLYVPHNVVAEDKQLDYFSFQFNGKSGMFVLDTAGGNRGVMLGDSKIKITFQRNEAMANGTYNGVRTTITSFIIQDIDGLKYKFARHGKTRVLKTDYCNKEMTQARTQPKLESGKVYFQTGFENTQFKNAWIIGSWHLTEIEDPLTGRKVTISYEDRTVDQTAGYDITYNQEGNYSTVIKKRSITITPEVTAIGYPDLHNVVFNYGAARADLNGLFVLSSIDVNYNSRNLSKHILNTTYFVLNRYGKPRSALQRAVSRLCLRSVTKIGVDLKEDAPPYAFDYYTGSNTSDDLVPPPFCYMKDVWGFYNGSNSVGFNNESIPLTLDPTGLTNNQLKGLCFRHTGVSGVYLNAKGGYAKNGLLRQVVYPTGGTLTYTYEQNTGMLNNVLTTVGGVHVSQTSATDGGYSNGCANPIVTNYYYVMNGVGSNPSLWGLEMPVNSVTTNVAYAAEWLRWKWSLSCGILGCCYYYYTYPGIQSMTQAVSLTDFQRFMQAVAPVLGVVSLVTTALDVINLVFISSGVMAWAAVIVDVIGGIINLVLTCSGGNGATNKANTVYFNGDLNGVSPLPAQYKRVEVVEGSGTNGKTIQTFTSEDDYPVWHLTNPAFSARQRFAPWAYGKPKLTTVLNASGNKIRETLNTYSWTENVGTCHPGGPCFPKVKQPLNLISAKCHIKKSTSQRSDDWSNPAFYDAPGSYVTTTGTDMAVDIYDLYSGRLELVSTSDKVFNVNDVAKYVETITQYVYNPSNLGVFQIAVFRSDGVGAYKAFRYADTYVEAFSGTANAQINALYNNNILMEPITVKESFGGNSFTHEKVQVYTTLPNGNVVPWKVLEQRFTTPNFNAHEWSPDDPTYWGNYVTVQTNTYNSTGQLIGMKDEGNRLVTNIYDYDNKYVVASVINADASLDQCAYTSFETTGFGGWSLTGTAIYIDQSGVTGKQAFNLNTKTLSRTLNTAKPYTLSFWANNANVLVTGGATLAVTGPTRSGYTYYEYNIAQGTSSVSLTGNSQIDELRLMPKMARMRTVTYDPLIGKTSDCDESNRITYYEYDRMDRMRFIKDESRNIVKMVEYNTIAVPNGCPTTYYSKLTTETFRKSNCSAGFLGSEVTYTVPANKYTSTISQEDADSKVDDEIQALAQTYADNNGACIQLYYNTVLSLTVTTQSCEPGYIGGNVTYTVPANRYSSTVSQAAANQEALDEIAANAQSWANDPANASCTPDSTPEWEWDNVTAYCANVNGQLPAHRFILEKDINPASSTYNQPRWSDVGESSACPSNLYYNTVQSGAFYKNNCSTGYGSAYTFTVQPGTYNSTVSLAAANQLAINDVNANGQAAANANGTCCAPTFTLGSGLTAQYQNVSMNGSVVHPTFVVQYPGTSSFTLATLTSSCLWPTGTRVIPFQYGSSIFNITVSTSGVITVSLVSGPMPTGFIPFQGFYDLYLTTYYSVQKSGQFTRNNCPAGQTGSTVTYTVPQFSYYSTIDQADADQKAQDDVNTNGQTHANNTGTCSVTCTFTQFSGTWFNKVVTHNGSTASFSLVFLCPNNNYSSGSLGTISTGCRPVAQRNVSVSESGRTWNVTITTGGVVTISLQSGTPASQGATIALNGSYAL